MGMKKLYKLRADLRQINFIIKIIKTEKKSEPLSDQKIKKYKPTIQIGFNRRFDPNHNKVQSEVLSGKIGKIEMIVITSRDPSPPGIDYLKQSGGIFRDCSIHDFDLAIDQKLFSFHKVKLYVDHMFCTN